jgi:hypothetical protein
MANALYGKGRNNFLSGGIFNISTDTWKIQFVDSTDYTLLIDTHEHFSDITVAGRVGTATAIANKTATLGVFDGDDVTVVTVTGDQFEYIVIYQDSGVETTSHLIACIDTATGLPCTPNGGDIICQWDSGANKILKL